MAIRIIDLQNYDERLPEAFARLVPQLSATAPIPDEQRLRNLVESPTTHLLIAEDDTTNEIVGTLTLVLFEIPTYRKAWIEDVITDEASRGRGVGRALVERAMETAREERADGIYLTSRASRVVARALYRKCGFEIVDTTLFRK